MGMAYTTRFSGYKVFECAIKYMGVARQNALALIVVPPSGANPGQQ